MEWISVNDRLPTKEDANIDDFVWGFPTYDGDVGAFYWNNIKESRRATHWAHMDIPEPPTE